MLGIDTGNAACRAFDRWQFLAVTVRLLRCGCPPEWVIANLSLFCRYFSGSGSRSSRFPHRRILAGRERRRLRGSWPKGLDDGAKGDRLILGLACDVADFSRLMSADEVIE